VSAPDTDRDLNARGASQPAVEPRLSCIVPAHDEAPLIVGTLRALQAAGRDCGVPWEVIVVDDASSDATAELARAEGARVVRVEARQIAAARNAGAAVARGDVFVFVDADTQVSRPVLRAVVAACAAGAVGGGAVPRFDEPLPRLARLWVPILAKLYLRAQLAAGCFLFCRADAFHDVGGFDERLFAAEEVALSRALRRLGRFVILPDEVLTSGRKLRTHSGFELLGVFGRLLLAGRKGLHDRSLLGVWYGPRRQDG
jgi:glycosyltransferase involved in cell wall biosynthesis